VTDARVGLLVVLAALTFASPAAASSADELVLQARAHEAMRDDDVAVRRYTEALSLDPLNADAWLGLAALRMKIGDVTEAERVYSSAFERLPTLLAALEGRAHARWALGRHTEAEGDLEAYAERTEDAAPLRELASWLGADGRTPAQLAVWRRLLARAVAAGDRNGEAESRRMVRALVVLVDGADPAASPVDPDETRRAMAHIAHRGG
jgi:tetratricopeptide (TPR) repeat protein